MPEHFRLIPLSTLRTWTRNPHKHPEKQIATLAAGIRRFGFTALPTLATYPGEEGGFVSSGNGRLAALRLLQSQYPGNPPIGIDLAPSGDWLIPCRPMAYPSKAEAEAQGLSDNWVAHMPGVEDDSEILADILRDLEADGVDFSGLGKDADELAAILADPPVEPSADDDDAPEPPAEPVSRLGEVYELGPHRLVCGDCADVALVAIVMQGKQADAVVTDPPYGQNQPGVTNDSPERLNAVVTGCVKAMPLIDGVCVAFSSPRTFVEWLDAVRTVHKFERMLWMYKEAQNTYPWRGWLLKSEAIVISSIGNAKWNDVHPYKHDCYKISEVSGELSPDIGWHGSVKPIAIVADICERVCPPGGLVFEPFGGSGTTLIAAAQTGRVARLIELDPRYCDVIRRRWTKWAKQNNREVGTGGLE